MQLLWEDDWLLAVYKPHGLSAEHGTHAHDSAERQAYAYVANQTGKRAPYVRVVHRLDRPTAGVLLMAKRKSALTALMAQFEAHRVRKVYEAVLSNDLPAMVDNPLRHWLGRDATGKRAVVYESPRPDAKEAVLTWESIAPCTVRIALQTGRFHQIRAQFAHIGCPVVGDVQYGAPAVLPNTIALVCVSLAFEHPVSGQEMSIALGEVGR